MKIILVAGARPNFMKIAPVIRAMETTGGFDWQLVHTGQHYDHEMSQSFFEDLEIPEPHFFLDAGSGSHAEQTAKVMVAFEQVCQAERPDWVLVVGDVNSTLACSVVAKKQGIGVAHVEAGLRSFDLSMPEEINRMVTDAISDLFFVTEESGRDNLLKEGKQEESIHFVGHVMVDNLLHQLEKVKTTQEGFFSYTPLKRKLGRYLFLTLHRPSNVDDPKVLAGIIAALNKIAESVPIVFPVHPRTDRRLQEFDLGLSERIHRLPPLGFRDSLHLWKDAALVLTDSGGLQEETSALGVRCLTLRENTERPVTCELGSNVLVGNNPERILDAIHEYLDAGQDSGKVPPLWDGRAAERIVSVLLDQGRRS